MRSTLVVNFNQGLSVWFGNFNLSGVEYIMPPCWLTWNRFHPVSYEYKGEPITSNWWGGARTKVGGCCLVSAKVTDEFVHLAQLVWETAGPWSLVIINFPNAISSSEMGWLCMHEHLDKVYQRQKNFMYYKIAAHLGKSLLMQSHQVLDTQWCCWIDGVVHWVTSPRSFAVGERNLDGLSIWRRAWSIIKSSVRPNASNWRLSKKSIRPVAVFRPFLACLRRC